MGYIKTFATFLALAIPPIIIKQCLLKWFNKKPEDPFERYNAMPNDFILIWYFVNRECKPHVYNRQACSDSCSYNYLTEFIRFIESAQYSISLCVCLLTCIEVQDALIRAHDRGVLVRFISDREMTGTKASRTTYLKNAGILIKVPRSGDTLLHHKFCLIDQDHEDIAKLCHGSLNLTVQGLTTNLEMVIFTTDLLQIGHYRRIFKNLWENLLVEY